MCLDLERNQKINRQGKKMGAKPTTSMRTALVIAIATSLLWGASSCAAEEYSNEPEVSPDGDTIQLDKDDPTFDLWRTPREDLMEGREPGPINIQRWSGGAGFQGMPTFFKQPIALTPADLAAR